MGRFDSRRDLKHVGRSVRQGGHGVYVWLTTSHSGLGDLLGRSNVSSVSDGVF